VTVGGAGTRRRLKSEAGENPARSRHCDRGAIPRDATGAEALGRLGRAVIRESGDCQRGEWSRSSRKGGVPEGAASGLRIGGFFFASSRVTARVAARSAGEEASMLRRIRSMPLPPETPGSPATVYPTARGRRHRRTWAIAILTAVALVTVGCGDEESNTGAQASPTDEAAVFPVTVKAANGRITIDERPESIVSLSPTGTEMLFAIGAGEQVVAVDEFSYYPPEAPTTKLSGLEPNIEAIAKYEPDLVVASEETGDLESSLEALGIPLVIAPAAQTLADSYTQIEQLGALTGNVANAADLIARMQSRIDALVDSVPDFDEPPTYYHELDQTYFSVTSDTFVGQVYSLIGLRNIADEAKGAGSQYPQLSAEYIIKADPDIIFLADTKCCDQSEATVSKRPGWGGIEAVKNGAVVELDDDIASRWGPRVVDYLRDVVEAVSELEPVSG
jgi:iron complex transport system substrate-binding protein